MNEIIITSKEDLQKIISLSVELAFSKQSINYQEAKTEILDIQQASEYLKIKIATIYGYTSQSQIPFIKRGKKLYFEKSKLEAWLKEGKKESISDVRKRLGGN